MKETLTEDTRITFLKLNKTVILTQIDISEK
jgi:hypothetical protein